MMQNIVALVDPDDESSWRKTLPAAINFARHTGARLHVLSIVPDDTFRMTIVAPQLISEEYERRLTNDTGQRLATLIKEHALDDVQLEQAVRFGNVYKEALRFAHDTEADLIVMGSHKPKLRDYLLGSNAEQIVNHATCSVCVVRE